MPFASALPAPLLARARVDQVAQLYASWHRTTLSMLFGAALLCTVLWGEVAPAWMVGWFALIAANQAWRGYLARAWSRQRPGLDATARWGRYWSAGSTVAGGLWGLAALVMFPASPAHQALLIVCLFGVVLGGLNLTAVYRPSFYGFVLPAIVPLIVRVALGGDQVHLYTALVMTVVLAFILAFGHQLNGVFTHSLAMRYENHDLIADLKRQSRAAHDARGAAEAANLAKSQLLAAASHDLRQPLHALGLYTAALEARADGTEWKPLVDNVQRAVATLESQFDQLLDLSRLESGTLRPATARVTVAPLLARVVAEFEPQARAKGIMLRAVRSRFAVRSDPALLERILHNLVANAIRYTEHGGVVIGCRVLGDVLAIDVVDTGVGIAPESLDHIFEEFYQVRDGRSSLLHSGMGLGLAIVRRLAQMLGHRVEVVSRRGCGSRFRIVAERASTRRMAATAPTPGKVVDARLAPAALAGALVAVVDDDAAALDAMATLLATWGATVAAAGDTRGLLVALAAQLRCPDLVIADLRLAGQDNGIDCVDTVRDEMGVSIPALLVSGDTGAAAEREARAAGLALLAKPVVPAILHAVAAALIARGLQHAGWATPEEKTPGIAAQATLRRQEESIGRAIRS